MNEFGLIARYFTRPVRERRGVGDDCALIDAGDRTLAVTTDLLTEHVHFFPGTEPASLGHKALAVNLSDLAAAGARPRCFLLAISLPRADPEWLGAFSRGMFALAEREGCELVGGDTTRAARVGGRDGPLTVCITAIGEVDRGCLRGRDGATPGDDLWVSGELGGAALAVASQRGEVHLDEAAARACLRRLDWPEPRVALGVALRGLASAAIDVSDGLAGDLRHLLERSGVGVRIDATRVPRPDAVRATEDALQQRCVLAGGDDYELLFTASHDAEEGIAEAGRRLGVAVTKIGTMTAEPGIHWIGGGGIDATLSGFDHFAGAA